MISGQTAGTQMAEHASASSPLRKPGTGLYRLASWLFAGDAMSEAVTTRVRLNASTETVWDRIMFYEEVPGRPPLILRALLSCPVRTEGDKTCVGATVRCAYRTGDLVKRITIVEPPHFLQFEVMEQRLGIENCALTLGGSYQLLACGDATDVVLTTNYCARLHPRYLWRPLETLLLSQLHSRILRGICAAALFRSPAALSAAVESRTPHCAPQVIE